MAAALYLVTKASSSAPNQTYVDEIHAVIANADDGDSDAVKIAEVEATVQGAGHPVPSGYFDTVQLLGVPTGGIMTTDEDAIIILRRTKTQVIA